MKFTLVVTVMNFLFYTHAFACGPQILTWPSDIIHACGDQVWGSDDAKLGLRFTAIDPVNANSDASFTCSDSGWILIEGTCTAPHNTACISQHLKAIDKDVYGEIDLDGINKILNSKASPQRSVVVNITNACDQGARSDSLKN